MFWKARRGRDLFRAYELQAIDALRHAMTREAADLLDRQIAGKELVQRLYDDAEVNTYRNRRGKQRHDPAIAFANRSPDLRLATLELHGPRGKGRAVFHALGGHVFQLRFSPKPAALGPRDEITVTRTTVHSDPMIPDAGGTTRDYLDRLDPAVRQELERAWAHSDRSIELAAAGDLYSVDIDDATYVVLAQLRDTSYVVARLDRLGPGVRRFDADGELIAEYEHLSDAMKLR